jgi:hypothetical protein
MKNIIVFTVVGLLAGHSLFAQTDVQKKAIATEVNNQKTANTKDILTTFFQAGIDNLLGDDHSFKFNSSFFGIDSIFRRKGSTPLSYEWQRRLRQASFNIALTGDSNNSITKIAGGFTFTLLNEKDLTQAKLEDEDKQTLKQLSLFMASFTTSIITAIAARHPTAINAIDSNNAIMATLNEADKNDDYSDLHPYIIEALSDSNFMVTFNNNKMAGLTMPDNEIRAIIQKIKAGKDVFHQTYVNIAEKYRRKPLWTFTPTGAYNRLTRQGEYSFTSYFTVGLGKTGKAPWELEANSSFIIKNDTALKASNYENKLFSISVGVNKVLMQNKDKQSTMEFKFFSQYDRQFGKVPDGVDKSIFTLNSTLRVNVFKSLWLPVTLKYDPDNHNFLGVFSVTANLGN